VNTRAHFVLILTLVLLAGVAGVVVSGAAPGDASPAQGGAPAVVSYQGEVRVDGTPYSGDAFFKFAVVNAAGDTSYWSNDGTSAGGGAPTAAVPLAVSDGLFSVLLGDTTLGGMTQALTADVFSQPDRTLRVWFSTSGGGPFSPLAPDTRIAAVPYALQAQEAGDAGTVDGLHASELGAGYQNVVVVAKSGGDYTSVQDAIDSIAGEAADNPYLVWVAPGVYVEQVTMRPHVHLQGAGQGATVISSTASSGFPPSQATLKLASDTSLRDLTVGNGGASEYNVALLATAGTTRTLVADVTARAQGGGSTNYALFLRGSGTGVTLQQVTALAENGSSYNFGLRNSDGAAATLCGGSFTARGGTNTRGIYNYGSGTTLEAESVTALGENGTGTNYGLENYGAATLCGGSFTARGGWQSMGIYNYGSGTTLEAESVTALGQLGSSYNRGLSNSDHGSTTLRGGSFTGRGGGLAHGIYNDGSGATLEAESVTSLGENGSSYNFGLYNRDGAAATLCGGSFTARGGTNTWGIYNYYGGARLEAESVTALGENGTGGNLGLENYGAATLRGGSFTARGGSQSMGITNTGSGATLEAESVTALGEAGTSENHGLYNTSGAAATASSSQFTGDSSYALFQNGGVVSLGVSQLDDGATLIGGGMLTCFQVYDGNFAAYTCP
jgi:hypothetical protein